MTVINSLLSLDEIESLFPKLSGISISPTPEFEMDAMLGF